MELSVRELRESDWETLQEWWLKWNWPVMSKDLLPMNGCGGLMVYKGDELITCGFLYLSNSKVAWLDWIVSNPEYRDEDVDLGEVEIEDNYYSDDDEEVVEIDDSKFYQ